MSYDEQPKSARAVEGEFKGFPTITIYTGKEFRGEEEKITLGLRKARAVDDCIDAIRSFIDKNQQGGGER